MQSCFLLASAHLTSAIAIIITVGTAIRVRNLVNIIGGEDLTLREAERIFQEVSSRISPDAMLKWGARIEPMMQKSSLKIMVVLGGVEFAEYTETGIKERVGATEDIDLDQIFDE